MAMQINDWTNFKVGEPDSYFGVRCAELKTVRHVSHVETALSIIAAEEIRPTLVFDESILNDKRILVSWFSPNFWNPGFRYGTVCFECDFTNLLEVSHAFWVEAVAYNTPACRILLTDQDHSAVLKPYEPRNHDGPWWYDEESDKHYFNGDYCLEFMVEGSVPISAISTLSFVKHHPKYCSVRRTSPDDCPELDMKEWEGGARFLARAIHGDVDLSKFQDHFIKNDGRANPQLSGVVTQLWRELAYKTKFKGDLSIDSEIGLTVSRAMLGAYAFGRRDEALTLAKLLKDEEAFLSCVAYWCSEVLATPDWKLLRDGL